MTSLLNETGASARPRTVHGCEFRDLHPKTRQSPLTRGKFLGQLKNELDGNPTPDYIGLDSKNCKNMSPGVASNINQSGAHSFINIMLKRLRTRETTRTLQ